MAWILAVPTDGLFGAAISNARSAEAVLWPKINLAYSAVFVLGERIFQREVCNVE